MENNTSKNLFLKKYTYINYILVIAFIVLNLLTDRAYRDLISLIFIVIMIPLFIYKIIHELKNDQENKTKPVQKTILNMAIVFGLLLVVYLIF